MYPFAEVNYLALLVASLASIVLGMIWYNPSVFGSAWMKMAGLSEADLKKGGKQAMISSMIIALVSGFVTAFILAQIFAVQGVNELNTALWTAFFVWLGFQAPIVLGSVLWEMRPVKLFLINAAYYLVNLLIVATIVALWV